MIRLRTDRQGFAYRGIFSKLLPPFYRLLRAIRKGDWELFEVLWNQKTIDPNVIIKYQSENIEPTYYRNISGFKAWIEKRPFDRVDYGGHTLLHYVAIYGHPKIYLNCLERLLNEGVDPILMNDKGVSALHIVASQSDIKAFELFLAFGADPHTKTRLGPTSQHNLVGYKFYAETTAHSAFEILPYFYREHFINLHQGKNQEQITAYYQHKLLKTVPPKKQEDLKTLTPAPTQVRRL